ncbi:uncharacterized protein LOC122084915 [Macadamia integrifolia]|uniref:uncharacterized protein LOC122084915 n=1 Tax=Macadamia integrifolia TaxID=60698 RepID=UPI001C4E73FB|nr:uncharacterized protein LOC122084915 [Macadamia integrifolia]
MAHSLVCHLPSDQDSSSKETMIINSLNLNIYSSLSKTNQIMSRYRPIAPKPQLSMHHHPILDSMSAPPRRAQRHRHLFRNNLSPHLPTKPSTGCKKRTKARFSPRTLKRLSTSLPEFSSSSPHAAPSPSSPSSSLAGKADLSRSMQQGFPRVLPGVTISRAGFDGSVEKPTSGSTSSNLVTLLLPHPSTVAPDSISARSIPAPNHYHSEFVDDEEVLDLNSPPSEIPLEKDLLQKLQAPLLCSKVIVPQPVRPIGSSISVGCISEDPSSSSSTLRAMRGAPKRPEEVEEEVESESLPAVISDSNNRVRVANSAYKKMVGQPECSWLDATYDGQLRGCTSKRISGKVMLHLSDTTAVPPASNGFSCMVRIERGSDEKKSTINAPCDVIRQSCLSKDYLFTWRFHTREAYED